MRRAWALAAIALAAAGCRDRRSSVVADRGYYATFADRTITIPPYGLTARVPSNWRCKVVPPSDSPTCMGDGWTVDWVVERETRTEPPDVLEPPEPSRDERFIMEALREPAEIAGFRGVIHQMNGGRRPICDLTFDGWRDDPGGRLHLAIYAQRWYEPLHVERPLAAILTTSERDGHGAVAFRFPPDSKQPDWRTELARDCLVDDAATHQDWQEALWDVENATVDSSDGLVPLLARRAADLARGDADDVEIARRMAEVLARSDPALARAALADVESVVTSHTTRRPVEADAKRWAILDLGVADVHEKLGDHDPYRDVATRLASLGAGVLLGGDAKGFEAVERRRRAPEIRRLFASWIDPNRTKLPADADYVTIATTLAPRAVAETPIGEHVLAMLADRSPHGALVCDRHFVIRGPRSSAWTTIDCSVGPEAHVALRVCDVYAYAARRLFDIPEIVLWDAEADRDRAIAALASSLRADIAETRRVGR